MGQFLEEESVFLSQMDLRMEEVVCLSYFQLILEVEGFHNLKEEVHWQKLLEEEGGQKLVNFCEIQV